MNWCYDSYLDQISAKKGDFKRRWGFRTDNPRLTLSFLHIWIEKWLFRLKRQWPAFLKPRSHQPCIDAKMSPQLCTCFLYCSIWSEISTRPQSTTKRFTFYRKVHHHFLRARYRFDFLAASGGRAIELCSSIAASQHATWTKIRLWSVHAGTMTSLVSLAWTKIRIWWSVHAGTMISLVSLSTVDDWTDHKKHDAKQRSSAWNSP